MPHVPSMMMIFEDETTIHNVLSDRKQILRKMLILPTAPPHPLPPRGSQSSRKNNFVRFNLMRFQR